MKPVSANISPVASFAEVTSQMGKQLFEATKQVSQFFESVASHLSTRATGMVDVPAEQIQLTTSVTAHTPLAHTQTALQGDARDYGAPHPNVRFAAGVNAQEMYFKVTDVALPQGLQTNWQDYAAGKATRPDPSTYLDPTYITEHLAQFHQGAVTFITPVQFERFTVDGNRSQYHGRPEGLFVMPAKWAIEIIEQAEDHESVPKKPKPELSNSPERSRAMLQIIEQRMGIPAGSWSGGQKLLAVLIEDPQQLNLRMVTGREAGANLEWRPGGYTLGGMPEAMIDSANLDQAIAVPFAALPEIIGRSEFTVLGDS